MEGNGDCYEAAVRFVFFDWENRNRDLVICHGEPLGQGPIAGIRHGHAWVEEKHEHPAIGWVIHDVSNGKAIHGMPWMMYYAIGNIDPNAVKRYTREEARRKLVETMIYGPWEET